ncbi:EF-P 5-aminopentanol modification-associated protein YfmH [Sulfobacillus harzensis]|uniref:Insulinase family protein n=1 Tax=Sulfobacillus harzensis TaxID=2729629 RepID=A0A7Y0L320_9FIRM|nr:pitrilysin family protein [Sulfobacillus harzensis]NMP21480.1 insulinase family protein [Sulfobacillus harzensis]
MQSRALTWAEIGERPVREQLDSGLTIFVLPKPGMKKTYATYATHYGSIDSHFRRPDTGQEVHVPDGIAHFLEHKMYEKPEGRDVFERFAELGAYTNAYTEYTSTTFLFSATSEIDACLETLVRLVEEPYFTPENVEKEKGIIEQEIRMYLDMPGDRLHSNLMQALYQKNPVRLDIAGSVESIRTITPDDLYVCYQTFYHPSNMVFFVAGDVEPRHIIDHLAQLEASRQLKPSGSIGRLFPEEPRAVQDKRIEKNMPVAAPLFLMGYKDPAGLRGAELLRRDIVMGLMWSLLLGPSSRLFNDLYQAGLINERFSAHYSSAEAYAMSALGGETPDPEKLEAVLLERLATEPFNVDDLARLKRKELGEFVGLFENLEDLAYAFNAYYFRGVDLSLIPEMLESVTLDDIEAARRDHLREESRAVSLVKPLTHQGGS